MSQVSQNLAHLSKREIMLATAYAAMFTPYRWGGDDHTGWDCSGFAQECLYSVGALSSDVDMTASNLLRYFRSDIVDTAKPGSLIFRSNTNRIEDVYHVAIAINPELCIESGGGTSRTRTPTDAERDNAYVRIRPWTHWRGKVWIADPLARLE